VRVGGKIVGIEKIADLVELRDGLAMIPRDAGREILRGFDATGRGFDGKAGNRDGDAGAAGIRVEDLIVDDDVFGRIGCERGGSGGTGDGDGLAEGGDFAELDGDLIGIFVGSNGDVCRCRSEG
jgi:hypothetical protein